MRRIFSTINEKWIEYLLEVFVLIAGIYGAFALESWGDREKDREQEQIVLEQLLQDYQTNKQQLSQKIEMRKEIIHSGYLLLTEIDNKGTYPYDSIIWALSTLTFDPTFDPVNNDLISSGNIQLISNPELAKMLSNWTSDIVAVQEFEQIWQDLSYNQLAEFYIKNKIARPTFHYIWSHMEHLWLLDDVDHKPKQDILHVELDVESIYQLHEIEGFASFAIGLNSAANDQSYALMRRIDKIIELLNQELDKNQ